MELPSDILIHEFPLNLSFFEIQRLCLSNKRLSSLCLSEDFWEKKTRRDFPRESQFKPIPMTWLGFYTTLISIPVYLNGDVDTRVILNPRRINPTIGFLASRYPDGVLVFIDQNLDPLVIFKDGRLRVNDPNLESIRRVVVIKDADEENFENREAILQQLVSPKSRFPVYGTGNLTLHIPRPAFLPGGPVSSISCAQADYSTLFNILTNLDIPFSENSTKQELCELLRDGLDQIYHILDN